MTSPHLPVGPAAVALMALVAGCAAPRPIDPPPAASSVSPGAPASAPRRSYGDDAPEPLAPFEARAAREARARLGRQAPGLRLSGPLTRAARAIARSAAAGEPAPLSREGLLAALHAAGAFDPAPVAHLAAGREDEALAALLSRLDAGAFTHLGVGSAGSGDDQRLVILLSKRKARLDRFPNAVDPGASVRLSGELAALLHPRAWVTAPDGTVKELELRGGRAFAGEVRFEGPGRYAVEVTGTGPAGPEVAALLGVSVGGAPLLPPAARGAEADGEAALLEAANRTRRAQGLRPVQRSEPLDAVARAHSAAMLAAGTVAHVLPGSGDLAARLLSAKVAYRRAYENVARGESAVAAHRATEESPAHRANLLAPGADRIGIGLARGALPTGEPIVYLTEVLTETGADAEPTHLTPEAQVMRALWAERERRGAPPLLADPALEAIARKAARAMRDADAVEPRELTEAALRLGRAIAASDAFVASDPAEATRSRNLPDRRFARVGVGVATGDSPRYGLGRLFIAVVYSN